jgi:hypothetical protein
MNTIIDPDTTRVYSIFSKHGRTLLKRYVMRLQTGGNDTFYCKTPYSGGAGKKERVNSCKKNPPSATGYNPEGHPTRQVCIEACSLSNINNYNDTTKKDAEKAETARLNKIRSEAQERIRREQQAKEAKQREQQAKEAKQREQQAKEAKQREQQAKEAKQREQQAKQREQQAKEAAGSENTAGTTSVCGQIEDNIASADQFAIFKSLTEEQSERYKNVIKKIIQLYKKCKESNESVATQLKEQVNVAIRNYQEKFPNKNANTSTPFKRSKRQHPGGADTSYSHVGNTKKEYPYRQHRGADTSYPEANETHATFDSRAETQHGRSKRQHPGGADTSYSHFGNVKKEDPYRKQQKEQRGAETSSANTYPEANKTHATFNSRAETHISEDGGDISEDGGDISEDEYDEDLQTITIPLSARVYNIIKDNINLPPGNQFKYATYDHYREVTDLANQIKNLMVQNKNKPIILTYDNRIAYRINTLSVAKSFEDYILKFKPEFTIFGWIYTKPR